MSQLRNLLRGTGALAAVFLIVRLAAMIALLAWVASGSRIALVVTLALLALAVEGLSWLRSAAPSREGSAA